MGYAFEDTNTAGAGSLRISGGGVVKHITGFASQSDAWISLVRDAHGEVSYDVGGQAGSWSGLLGVTTTAITSIRLYVEHDQLCGPCGPHLQPTRFDYVSVNDVVPMGPYLDVQNLVAGGQASFVVSGADPLSIVSLAYSLSGGGPTGTPFGFALLSPPIKIAAQANVDLAGNATFQIPVPPAAAGLSVWLQAYDHGPGSFTQGVQEVIQ